MNKASLIILLLGVNTLVKAQEYPQMIFVEGGSIVMGETCQEYRNEKKPPKNKISLESFRIAKTETTKAQWKAYCTDTGKHFQFSENSNDYNDKTPANFISWNSAIEYCEWLSKKTGKTYRLPTEAEWEYCARGGKKSKGFLYVGSNDLNEVGWYIQNSNTNPNPHAIKKNSIHEVGLKKPNELGLYDMSGNVSEWCYYHCNTQFEGNNISRGGDYLSSSDSCLVNWRENNGLGTDAGNGFRVVEVISQKKSK